MKQAEEELEAEAAEAVEKCFAEVPFCSFRWGKRNVRAGSGEVDRVGKLRIEGGGERTILLEVKRDGQPRNLRNAAYALRRCEGSFQNAYGIIVAPYISEAAADILRQENLGYVDLAGNCRICLDKIYIRKEGQPNPFAKKRGLRSLYSPKSERVLRVLLENPRRIWLVKELSQASGVSLGQTFNVKKLLDAREWIGSGERGFKLTQPEALLREWSSAYRSERNRAVEFYAMATLPEIELAIGAENRGAPRGALTAFSAAARYAPAVRYQKVSAYVKGTADEVAEKMGWKRVTSGGNVSLIEPYDEGVFLGEKWVDGVQVVSAVQAYLDVQGSPARGRGSGGSIISRGVKTFMVNSRTDYSELATKAANMVMLELVRILGEYKGDIVLVGGWVPELLFSKANPKHIGSIDVDLAINHRTIDEEKYRTILEHLKQHGYTEGPQPFIFFRTVKVGSEEVTVQVDLLSGEYGGTGKSRRHQSVQDIKARKARGCDLAFEMSEEVKLEGVLPKGGKDSVVIRVAGIVPFLVMKGMALADRFKTKDAWDVYFCLLNFPGGNAALAELFRPHLENGLVREGLEKIREKFQSVDHAGPIWCAEFDEIGDPDDRSRRIRDAYERVADLLRRVAGE